MIPVSPTAWCVIGAAALVVAARLVYLRLIRPMRRIAIGIDLLREQDFSSRMRHVGQSDADRVVDMFNRMMDTLKAQQLRVREQNEFLDLLVEASPMGVLTLDRHGTIESINPAGSRMLEQTPALHDAMANMADGVVTVVRPGLESIYRISRLHFMDRGWPRPFVLIESLTDEVREAERTTLTRVIRTMAHEVNNSMAGILSTLHTVGHMLEPQPEMRQAIDACITRAGELTGFIGRFAEVAKVPEPTLCLTDFHELVESSLPVLESLCTRSGATLAVDTEQAAPLRLDPAMMQQVLVNVVKNAAEAAGKGGHVCIHATGRTLTVTDNGPGLDDGTASQLFAAPFTTKPEGQGLGLLLVAEILRRHHATFSLRTDEPGRTVFTVTFGKTGGNA
ncbi:MAG: PAS domain-containing sensor histidine kinase [Muribaculaceae bacterium]|nr:PAS domain-containing sensor histidine kinase [Muribaculaceae bacterium]